jgi:hypothetical protein
MLMDLPEPLCIEDVLDQIRLWVDDQNKHPETDYDSLMAKTMRMYFATSDLKAAIDQGRFSAQNFDLSDSTIATEKTNGRK